MKDLKEYLNESLVNEKNTYIDDFLSIGDAADILKDYFEEQAKKNHVSISEKDLEDLAHEVAVWYDREETLTDFNNEDEFISFVSGDIFGMIDSAPDNKYRKQLEKIFVK